MIVKLQNDRSTHTLKIYMEKEKKNKRILDITNIFEYAQWISTTMYKSVCKCRLNTANYTFNVLNFH